jgi:hypothetical protein
VDWRRAGFAAFAARFAAKAAAERSATFLPPPKGILSMTHYPNIKIVLSYQ